ncbi:hypothetical protein H8A97_03800 [Bradyrhizobium sp. Arg62]|uniref:hypothetical protein n=1 Tax=Bradyrhizobium brasilense TaxID=1419277 RepID=UPI001E58E812|nr:hypothetical protein [Bradyrhizobium brasilense]MCC8944248.1 hypothetical protein [Bradyrhizobium brasilense]
MALPDISRRAVIVGAASAVLATGAPAEAASEPQVTVDYEDATRRALIITYVRRGRADDPKNVQVMRLDAASFYAFQNDERQHSDGIRGHFIRYRTETGWAAKLLDAQFPGGKPFQVLLTLKPDQSKQNWSLSLAFERLAGHSILLRTGVPNAVSSLDDLLFNDSMPEIAAALSEPATKALMEELFGPRLLFAQDAERQAVLTFHRDGHFRLIGTGKGPTFSVLKDEGRDCVVFSALSFALLSRKQADLRVAGEKQSARRDAAFLLPKEAGALRVTAGGAGATPPKAADAEDVRALFENEDLRLSSSGQNGVMLYGLARDARFLREFAVGSASGVAVRLGPDAAFAIKPEPVAGSAYVGLRNAGAARETVMSLRSWFALRVQPDAKARAKDSAKPAPEAKFDALTGTLWRGVNAGIGDANKQLDMIAELEPQSKLEIATRFGPFCVGPLPAIRPRPGAAARVPPIRVESTAGGTLSRFAAPMALTHAAIPVDGDTEIFTSLDFDEAECLFRIPDVRVGRVRKDGRGTLIPEMTPPQAESIVNLGGAVAQAQISLARARLSVRRPRDLLSLGYRFQDLLLELDDTGKWIVPDRRLADFVAHRPPLPLRDLKPIGRDLPEGATTQQVDAAEEAKRKKAAELPDRRRRWFLPTSPQPACSDPEAAATAPSRFDAPRDPRPLMIVEFPPQHIAERAFFRQLPTEPKLPAPSAGTEVSRADAEILRNGDPTSRLNKRKEIKGTQSATGADFTTFVAKFLEFAGDLPEDQRIYVGEDFLDPDARRIARKAALAPVKSEDGLPPRDRLRSLPDIDIPQPLLVELREELGLVFPQGGAKGGQVRPEPEDLFKNPEWAPYLHERELRKEQRDTTPNYKRFRALYVEKGLAGKLYAASISAPQEYPGRETYVAFIEKVPAGDLQNRAIADILAVIKALDDELRSADAFKIPAEARLSGPSRLAFRISADDYEGGRPDPERRPGERIEGKPAGSFPFTMAALTNWGSFDLAVVRRAEKLFDPLPGGRAASRLGRSETLDEAEKLLHQGLTRGDAWARRLSDGKIDADCPAPKSLTPNAGRVTGAQRMAEIYGVSREPPRWHETLIEMPFRLMLSPAQDASFRTPLPIPQHIAQKLGLTPNAEQPVPLWFATLDETSGTSSVRAIWSPDFRPEALVDREIGTPPRGPWAPWALGHEFSSIKPPAPDTEQFRASLDAYDRHELVILSSVPGLPVRGRRKEDGSLTDLSQINIPAGFELRDALPEKLGAGVALADRSAIYKPQPLDVSELTLTALGGTFDADTSFVPPASAKVVVPVSFFQSLVPEALRKDLKDSRRNLFDALSIERWRHLAVLGRDIKVEVVYKGFLFPLGHRASLIKLTERRFYAAPDGRPTAFLIQRMFLRVGMPEKNYPAIGQPNGGRRWPVERLELLTRVTPDIVDPAAATVGSNNPTETMVANEGRIFLRAGSTTTSPGLVFWPRTSTRDGADIRFEMQIDQRGTRVRLPLIFVDNTAANDEEAMRRLAKYYNTILTGDQEWRRRMQHSGIKRRYAPETEPDNTSFETLSWLLEAEGQQRTLPKINCARQASFDNVDFDFPPLLQGADQPPFYPVMAEADVRIERVDRFAGGRVEPVTVKFDNEYTAFGFPTPDKLTEDKSKIAACKPADALTEAQTDVFLDFKEAVKLEMGAAGDRSGGATRPTTNLIGISRSRGPIGGTVASKTDPTPTAPASAQIAKPDAASFFDTDAKILGILTFAEALKLLLAAISQTPEFKEVTEYASSLITQGEQNGSAAIAKVRDALLIPLRDALDTLQSEWAQTIASGAAATGAEGADAKLTRLYPDVGASYADLRRAVDAAIETSAAVTELPALTEHFAKIYASGRRFIAAIDRVARDPVAPVRAALKDAFKTTLDDLIRAAGGLIDRTAAAALANIESEVREQVRTLLEDPALVAYRRLVFALPAVDLVAAPSTASKAAEKKIEETFTAVLRGKRDALLDAFLSDDVAVENALKDISDELLKQLEAAIKELRTVLGVFPVPSPMANALEQAVNNWKARGSRAADRLEGIIFRTVVANFRKLLGAAREIKAVLDDAKFDPARLLEKLKLLASAAQSIAQPAIDNALGGARTMCGEAVAAIAKVLNVVAPSPGVVPDPADECKVDASSNCGPEGPLALTTPVTAKEFAQQAVRLLKQLDLLVVSVRDYAAVSTEPTKSQLTTLATRLEGLRNDVRAAADNVAQGVLALDRAAFRFRKPGNALDENVCKSLDPDAIARLPLDALAGLGKPQAALINSLNELVGQLRASLGMPPAGSETLRSALTFLAGTTPPAGAQDKLDKAIENVTNAAKNVGGLVFGAQRIAQDITSLKGKAEQIAEIEAALKDFAVLVRKSPLTEEAGNRLEQAMAVITKTRSDIGKLELEVRGALQGLRDKSINDIGKTSAAVQVYLNALEAEFKRAQEEVNTRLKVLIEQGEQAILSVLTEALIGGEAYRDKAFQFIARTLNPAVDILSKAQTRIVDQRNKIYTEFNKAGGTSTGGRNDILADLSSVTLAQIARLLLVAPPGDTRVFSPRLSPDPAAPADDYLTREMNELNALSEALKKTAQPAGTPLPPETARQIALLFADWTAGRASALVLAETVRRASERVLSGDLGKVVDLEGARRRIESKIKEMVPSKVALSYGLSAEMKSLKLFGFDLFVPQRSKLLTIDASARYDLLEPQNPPVFIAKAELSAFDINLFEVVTLMFDGAKFNNDSTKGSDFALTYNDFKIGKKAEFIEPLQKFLNPQGSGPYVKPNFRPIGIEAGYKLDLGIISIGNVSFSNVSLNAACRLPFENRQAVFTVSIGRRDSPFIISAAPYGGGGFLGLLANSKRMIGFEASFEYGGAGAFKFGPLEGQGRITMGIYINHVESPDKDGPQGTTVEGFFFAGGSAHIACFSMSTSLSVRISQQPGGSMQGSAQYTFSFSIGVKDIEFKVRVAKSEKKGFSGSGQASLIDAPTRFAALGDFSGAYAMARGKSTVQIRADTACQGIDWKRHDSYFANDVDGFPA